MRRLLAGVAAAVILAGSSSAASGFSLFGSDKPDKPAQSDDAKTAAAKDNADKADAPLDAKTLEANLTNELAKAKTLRQQGDFGGAAHALAQLMLVAPDDARVIGEYGKVMVNQGRSDDAIAFLKHALDMAPNDWTLYSAIGMAYDQKDDFANSKLAYDRALLLAPGEPAVLNNYAMSRMLAGDLAGAQKYMAQAMAQPGAAANPKLAENAALIAKLSGHKTTAAAAERPAIAATTQAAPVTAVKTQTVAVAQPPQTTTAMAAKAAPSAIEKAVIAKAVKAADAPVPPAQPQLAKAAPVPAAAAVKATIAKSEPQTPVAEKVAPMELAKAPPRPIVAASVKETPAKETIAKAEAPKQAAPAIEDKAIAAVAITPVRGAVAAAPVKAAPVKVAKDMPAKAAKPSLLPEAVSVADLNAPVMVKRKSGMVMMQRVPMDPEAGPVETPAAAKAEPQASVAKAEPAKAEPAKPETGKTRIADAKKDVPVAAKAPPPPQLRTAAD
ncbi:MAG: tetratricopeptide repeat protein [Alphaproteobacteria bacterium]|nr:tetratricopeptide repeat protein [Alphaproteobacteria bacterium]MBN9569238.1 tetratricopeptide repeat protein [Alphaproteobacteria bacterium]MBN9577634.1 tetratricopeptide repeat protein [Alphaproteobacteria bacterium]